MKCKFTNSKQWPLFSLLILTRCLLYSTSSPFTVKNNVVRIMEGTAVLGRGYSTTTNSFQSTCLNINGIATHPSYNYDYHYTDLTRGTHPEQNLAGKVSGFFGYAGIKAAVSAADAYSPASHWDPKKYVITVTMRIERYFSSLLEDKASLSDSASKMLIDKDYIGFFTTCGPNYVRSVHRAQEVTVIFNFESDDKATAQEFGALLKTFIYSNGNSMTEGYKSFESGSDEKRFSHIEEASDYFSDYPDILKSLSIEMLAYGLGLQEPGRSDALVATGLDDFHEAMKFAFDSMTKSDGSNSETGMIYGVEVVPWADNAEFLNSAEINANTLWLPIPRGRIKNSIRVVEDNIENRVCQMADSVADDLGKCCEPFELVKVLTESGGIRMKCEPHYHLSPMVMRDNLAINAEFAVRLSSVVRDKMKILNTLSNCISVLRSFPEHTDYTFLQSVDNVGYDGAMEMTFTVKELKIALDPSSDLRTLTMVSNERDEYVEMFYRPCVSALYGMNFGNKKDTDSKFFMAEPWYNHEECMRASCLQRNMAWDRKNGRGCVNGILRQTVQSTIPTAFDPHCVTSMDVENGGYICKYTPNANTIRQMDFCRANLPQGRNGRGGPVPVSMEYLIDHFCAPKWPVEVEQTDRLKKDEVDSTSVICRTGAVWINELHYHELDDDIAQFVEIGCNFDVDLTGYRIILYDGSNGESYGTGILPDSFCSPQNGFVVWDSPVNIRDTGANGVALVDTTGAVVEFISYQGIVTATDGPAMMMSSVNIGVSESSATNTTSDQSLQLTGAGCSSSDFLWQEPRTATKGIVNMGQEFTCAPPPPPTLSPTVSPSTLPSTMPSINPTGIPSESPSLVPTVVSSFSPSDFSSDSPTLSFSNSPSLPRTTLSPTNPPTLPAPSRRPSSRYESTIKPVGGNNNGSEKSDGEIETPSVKPIAGPTADPTVYPSADPTVYPSAESTVYPSADPTVYPSIDPTVNPSADPTVYPSADPTVYPSADPTVLPSKSAEPTRSNVDPTVSSTDDPTVSPSDDPTVFPSVDPTVSPSVDPTVLPSTNPTFSPSSIPTDSPTESYDDTETDSPTGRYDDTESESPTGRYDDTESDSPTGRYDDTSNTLPTGLSDDTETDSDDTEKNNGVIKSADTDRPSADPSISPSVSPSISPSVSPSANPSVSPSADLSSNQLQDTETVTPSTDPTIYPSTDPTANPSTDPTVNQSTEPSTNPTNLPTQSPTKISRSTPNPTNSPTSPKDVKGEFKLPRKNMDDLFTCNDIKEWVKKSSTRKKGCKHCTEYKADVHCPKTCKKYCSLIRALAKSTSDAASRANSPSNHPDSD